VTTRIIIFDLDGTLIDSAPSILSSMLAAFEATGIQPSQALTQSLIGPPLVETLTSVLRTQDAHRLPALIEHFKHHYDETGYRATHVYEGVPDMLESLNRQGAHLYIATNKRIVPTRRIMDHLGWADLFQAIYALDYWAPSLPNKASMLLRLRDDLQTFESHITYVGDRSEDADVAKTSGLPFVWAAWGYGPEKQAMGEYNQIAKPSQLLKYLQTT